MRRSKRLTALLLVFVLMLTCVPVGVVKAAKKKSAQFAYRIDTLDLEMNRRLAVDVLSQIDGKVHVYRTEAGSKTPTKDEVRRNGYAVDVQAKIETTAYSSNGFDMDELYDIYIVFEDDWGTLYGPWKKANYKPSYFPAGDGTISNPYQIWTQRHLYNVYYDISSGNDGKEYIQMQDIVYDNTLDFTTIWGRYSNFKGSYNGNNHCIYGMMGSLAGGLAENAQIHDLYIVASRTKEGGLFCARDNNGTIKGCAAYQCSVEGVGVSAGAICGENSGAIRRCEVQNVTVDCSDNGGGIAGLMFDGVIELCYAEASVRGGATAGGIVGRIQGGRIDGCMANPSLLHVNSKDLYKGGIAGQLMGSDAMITGNLSNYQPSTPEYTVHTDASIIANTGESSGYDYRVNCVGNVGAVPYLPKPPISTGDEAEDEKNMQEYMEMMEYWPTHNGELNTLAGGAMQIDPIENYISINASNIIAFTGLHIAYTRAYPNETEAYNKACPLTKKTVKYTAKSQPAKVTISSAKRVEGNKISISWKKVKKADGYEIQLSKGKYVTFENYTELKKTSYTTYGLSKGYAYGVRVRAYRTVKGKKVYGQFSTIKYVKLFDD